MFFTMSRTSAPFAITHAPGTGLRVFASSTFPEILAVWQNVAGSGSNKIEMRIDRTSFIRRSTVAKFGNYYWFGVVFPVNALRPALKTPGGSLSSDAG